MNVPVKEKAVVIQDLEKRFDNFVAVNRISFEVEKGTIFGILGPNGAGKSTTIRLLCGILEPTGGSGTIAGYDIYRETEKIKAHIGYMSQKFSLYEDLTVEENIDFYNGIYRFPDQKKSARKSWVVTMANLQNHLKTMTAKLPMGWKQRLALGCALLHEPSILFLDEPTSGVDPVSRRNFWKLIYDLSGQGVTIIVTTHYVEEAEYFDRIGLVYRGEIIANGTPEYLKKELMTEKVLEIFCERSQDAMHEIKGIAGVGEVGLFGNSIHIVVDELEKTQERILAQLSKKNIHIEAIEAISPSMEDLFVSLIEAHDRKQTTHPKGKT